MRLQGMMILRNLSRHTPPNEFAGYKTIKSIEMDSRDLAGI